MELDHSAHGSSTDLAEEERLPTLNREADLEVARLVKVHGLSAGELERLHWVLREYEAKDHIRQLQREIENILAARKLSENPIRRYGRARIERIRERARSLGLLDFTPVDEPDEPNPDAGA